MQVAETTIEMLIESPVAKGAIAAQLTDTEQEDRESAYAVEDKVIESVATKTSSGVTEEESPVSHFQTDAKNVFHLCTLAFSISIISIVLFETLVAPFLFKAEEPYLSAAQCLLWAGFSVRNSWQVVQFELTLRSLAMEI